MIILILKMNLNLQSIISFDPDNFGDNPVILLLCLNICIIYTQKL